MPPISPTIAGHPALWSTLAAAYPSLLAVTNGLRLLCTVLAVAIALYWSGSLWRCLRDRARDGDAHRAAWVPLAIAVLLFDARWFVPTLSDLARGRMLVVAHSGIALTMLLAIYIHGRHTGALRVRRALVAHLSMLAGCIAISTILR